jgi:hypothetical protein
MHKHLACLLLLAATTAGCQVKPGEYRIYRLALNQISQDCNPAPEVDLDHTGSETFFDLGLVAIYASDADTYFLETGAVALLGSRDGTGYTFTGNDTQTDNWKTDEGYSRNFTVVATTDVIVDLTLKGKGLTGTATTSQSVTCSGSTEDCQLAPGPNGNAAPFSCVTKAEYFGSEVSDVDIEYVINGGGALDGG